MKQESNEVGISLNTLNAIYFILNIMNWNEAISNKTLILLVSTLFVGLAGATMTLTDSQITDIQTIVPKGDELQVDGDLNLNGQDVVNIGFLLGQDSGDPVSVSSQGLDLNEGNISNVDCIGDLCE